VTSPTHQAKLPVRNCGTTNLEDGDGDEYGYG